MKRYPGIRPFTAEDAPLFYGREEEKRDLFQMVVLNDIVVLFGKSGTGKSSLLNAGVSPQFRNRNLQPVFIRLNNTAIAPEQQVFEHLREHDYIPKEIPAGLTLWEYFKHFWYVDLGETFTPVVILDQFEELFTLYTPEERKNFVDQFADMVNGRMPASLQQKVNDPKSDLDQDIDWPTPPNVKFILSIRSDFLYLLNELAADIPSILRTRFQLNMLNRSHAIQAITLPAMAAGGFESPSFQYEETALKEIIEVLGKKETDQLRSDLPESEVEIEAFQLQLFCQQIENQIIAEKHAAGFTVDSNFFGGQAGIQKIIGEFYKGVISRVPEQHQVGVETMVATYLIRNKRRIIMEESAIREECGIPQKLLDQLHDERLLRKEARAGSFYYEISHDTLLEPVLTSYQHIADRLEKERLEQEQLAKEKELAAIKQKAAAERQRAEAQMKLREAAEQSARQAKRRTRLAMGAFIIALLLAGLAGIFWKQAKRDQAIAIDKTAAAIKAQIDADTAAAIANRAKIKADTSAAIAEREKKIADLKTLEAKGNLAQFRKAFATYLAAEAKKAFEIDDPRLALRLGQEALRFNPDNEIARSLVATQLKNYLSTSFPNSYSDSYRYSDNSKFLTFFSNYDDRSGSGTLNILNLETENLIDAFPNSLGDSSSYSDNSKFLTFFSNLADNSATLNILNLETENLIDAFPNSYRDSYRYSENSKFLTFFSNYDNSSGSATLNILNLETENLIDAFPNSDRYRYRYSDNSKFLTFFSNYDYRSGSGTLNILNLETENLIDAFPNSYFDSDSSSYSDNSKSLTFFSNLADNSATLNILNLETENILDSFPNSYFDRYSYRYSDNSKFLTFFSNYDNSSGSATLNILNLETENIIDSFPNSARDRYRYSDNSKFLTFFSNYDYRSESGTLNILNLETENLIDAFPNSLGDIDRYRYSDNSKFLTFFSNLADNSATLNILNLETENLIDAFPNSDSYRYSYSDNSKFLTFFSNLANNSATLNILNLETENLIDAFPNSLGDIDRYSDNSKFLTFFSNYDYRSGSVTLNILNLETENLIDSFPNSARDRYRYSDNSKFLTFFSNYDYRSGSGTLNILNLETENLIDAFPNSLGDSDRYSDNSKFLTFFSNYDSRSSGSVTLNILNLETENLIDSFPNSSLLTIRKHSADSKYLATQLNDEHVIKIWNLEKQKVVRQIRHQEEIWLFNFSKDGRFLKTYSLYPGSENNGVLKITNLSVPEDEILEYYDNLYAPLSKEERAQYGLE